MSFKQNIVHHYHQLINDKIVSLTNALNDLRESSKNETKSSAGDKYETTRAMLQLEQDKIHGQLNEAKQQQALLNQIDANKVSQQITIGSLVKTSKGYLLLSLALGKIVVDGITVIAVSPQSPLGLKLIGLKANDTAEMNGIEYLIKAVE